MWWVWWIIRILAIIIFVGVLLGSGIFSYICFKAQARKWGAVLVALVALCMIALYWIIFMI